MSLEKCQNSLEETQKLINMMVQDDLAQKFQFNHHSFYLPKYCFLSILYTKHYLHQNNKFLINFNDKIKSKIGYIVLISRTSL